MSAVLRQQRFFAAAKARLERKGEWGRLAESGEAAVAAWDAWDPPRLDICDLETRSLT